MDEELEGGAEAQAEEKDFDLEDILSEEIDRNDTENEPVEQDEAQESEQEAPQAEEPQQATNYSVHHWPEKYKAAFGSADPAAQGAWAEQVQALEGKWQYSAREAAEWRKFGEPIRQMITPQVQHQLSRSGMDVAQGINYLMQLNDYYSRDPKGYLRKVTQAAGLKPSDVFPEIAVQPGGEDDLADPEVNQLRQQMVGLQDKLGQYDQYIRDLAYKQEYAQGHAAAQQHIQKINEFQSQVDEYGEQRYPLFHQVKGRMSEILRHDPRFKARPDSDQNKLVDAYWEAVFDDPFIRDQIMAAEQEEYYWSVQDQLQQKDRELEAERARRARSPVRGPSRGQGSGDGGRTSLDDILNDVLESANL